MFGDDFKNDLPAVSMNKRKESKNDKNEEKNNDNIDGVAIDRLDKIIQEHDHNENKSVDSNDSFQLSDDVPVDFKDIIAEGKSDEDDESLTDILLGLTELDFVKKHWKK